MRYRPIQLTVPYFSGIIRRILDRGWPSEVILAGSRPSLRLKNDPSPRIDADARLMVMLEGRHRHAITRDESREDCALTPGKCLYWPAHAWNISCWKTPCLFFGIVFRRSFTRYIIVDFPGGAPPRGTTPYGLHTVRPIGGAALHLMRALDFLADRETGAQEAAHSMLIALLQLAESHLRESFDSSDENASGVWQFALDHMNASYSDPMLSRDSVAGTIGVHPNYLSALASKKGGGFHHALEEIRVSHARHMLESSRLKTLEIADLCGYSGTTSFIRAFHRVMGEYPQSYRERKQVGDAVKQRARK